MFDDILKVASNIGSTASKLQPLLSTFKLGADLVGSYAKYSGQKKLNSQMRSSIDQATADNQAALAERNSQQQSQIKETQSARARQAMVEKARLQAIATAAGGGNSADRLAQMSDFNLGSDVAMLEANAGSLDRQHAREMASLTNRATSQKNQLVDPSLFGLFGDAISAGIGYSMRGTQANPQSGGLQTSAMTPAKQRRGPVYPSGFDL